MRHDPATLRAVITADPALATLLAEAIARDDGDRAHDHAHALRVALWTVRLGGDALDPREAIAAALLHDAVNPPKSSAGRAGASERSAAFAGRRLAELGFAPKAIDRITAAIRDHSWSRGAAPVDALGRALQDADRLEALGAIGLMRWIETGARLGAEWFDPEDPWAAARPLDDTRYSVDHCFSKLLRLPETMRTEAGRAEAKRRAALLRRFLEALGEELGVPPPA